MKRSWQRLGPIPAPRRAQPISVPFQLSFQCRRDFSTTLPALPPEARDKPARMRGAKMLEEVLMEARLEREAREARRHKNIYSGYADHKKVYSRYLAAVDGEGVDPLPLEVHQAVLRACTLPPDDIRAHTVRLLQEWKVPQNQLVHPYRSRFRKIMLNILNAGLRPSIEDYRFIMSQFAAAGDFAGIRRYMELMAELGLKTDNRTFGFYLQAIAQQISLANSNSGRSVVIPKLVNLTVQAIREMNDRKMPPSPANADLAFRILSEVHNPQSLPKLVRLIYGMDLSYLDSPPIDADSLPAVVPFSIHALNSLLRRLGKWGQISKMIYVFETLTNPLPLPTKPDNTFDDDDDDFVPVQQMWKSPSVEPNTTAYNTLIKYCITRGYPALAKHYTRQLVYQERSHGRWLRDQSKSMSLSEVMAPRNGVTLQTLRPICTFANTSHNIALMKWVIQVIGLSSKRKYWACAYIDRIKSRDDFRLASPTSHTPTTPEPSSSSSPSSQKSSGSFTHDICVQHQTLKRDLLQFNELGRSLKERVFWIITRNKVRLGRRVWRGKTVYLRNRNARVSLEREPWKKKVNFREDMLTRVRRPEEVKPKWRRKKYRGKRFDPAIANIGWSRRLRRS